MKFKSLKKASAVLLCALITLAGVLNVFAAGQTYSIPEASNMQITLPEDMTAVTRSADANDKYFSLFGIDYNSTMQRFEASNIYLQGMNSSSDLTLTVSVQTTDQSTQLVNYNQLESDKLSEVARNFLSQTEYTACTVDQAVSNAVWLEFNIRVNESGSLIQAYQANTVYEGKSVNITLQRNGGNVTAQDYEIFSGIVKSAEFGKLAIFNLSNPMMPYILIGAGVLLILIIVFIIIIVRTAKHRKKKSKNDKILEELAGKYTSNRPESKGRGGRYSAETTAPDTTAQADTADNSYDLGNFDRTERKKPEPEKQGRRYSDDEIDALLGDDRKDNGEKANFTQALPEAEEEQERAKDDTLSNNDQVSEFFEDEPTQPEENTSSTKKFDFPDKPGEIGFAAAAAGAVIAADEAQNAEETAGEEAQEETESSPEVIEKTEAKPVLAEPEAEETAEVTEEKAEEVQEEAAEEIQEEPSEEPEAETAEIPEKEEAPETGEIPEAEFVDEAGETGAPEQTVKIYGEKPGRDERKNSLREEIKNAIKVFESDEEDEDEQYNNDEVLVRAEAKHTKFADSNDFFDEAPKRVMGVISSKDIQNAEEYDVIGEMERRADEFEKEPPKKGEKFKGVVKSIAGGIKSFFVHCGYFITNVRREIKRKKALKKRQQYEEDRKRRARERAERQRRQAENGGLIQVHKRTDRKPPQRRPGSGQRRPSSRRRPSSSQNRRGNPPRRR